MDTKIISSVTDNPSKADIARIQKMADLYSFSTSNIKSIFFNDRDFQSFGIHFDCPTIIYIHNEDRMLEVASVCFSRGDILYAVKQKPNTGFIFYHFYENRLVAETTVRTRIPFE